MTIARILAGLVAAALTTPAFAGPVVPPVVAGQGIVTVQDKAEHGKKNAKGKAKHEDAKNAGRSNKGGETRAKERSDQVQGLQDTGKGPGKRP
jgi:hypothetical protein